MLWRLDPAERFVSRPALEEWPTYELVPQDEVSSSMALSVIHWELDRTGIEWPHRDLADTVCLAAFSPDSRGVIFNSMHTSYSGFGLELVAYKVVSGKRPWCARRSEENEEGVLLLHLPTNLGEPVQALAFDHDGRILWLATEETLVQYQPHG